MIPPLVALSLLLAAADPSAPGADRGAPLAAPEEGGAKEAAKVTPLRLSARVDKARASLGEPFELRIEVVLPPELAVELPRPLSLAPLTLRGPPQVSRDRAADGARTTFVLPLANVSSLAPRVPDLPLRVLGPRGPGVVLVPGQALELDSRVAAAGASDAARAHRGPKPPVPVWVRSFLWAGLLAGLIALGAAVFLLRRLLRARARLAAPAPLQPHQIALDRLTLLRRRQPWTRGEGRAAIFELSETLRAYLGQRLAFDALDLTSEELLRALGPRPLPGLDLPALEQQLAWEELVKFARVEPQARECEDAIDLALSIVRRTRPVAADADAPPAAPAGEAAR